MTELYSGATSFGVPLQPYFGAYILMMSLYLGPTLVALGWALTAGQRRGTALPVVRAEQPVSIEEERTNRAA